MIKHPVPSIIIYGPTAVGKTDLALSLARLLNGSMINADSGQCYTPLSIGTAKPPLESIDVPYYLFDSIDEPRDMTVMEYRNAVIATIQQSNEVPIIVGGSGFYILSLLFPPQAHSVAPPPEIPHYESSWDHLYSIDPQRALHINKHDLYRINRALAIWYQTGTLPSAHQPQYQPSAPYVLINVTRERAELYTRINDRVAIMMNDGWIDEVRQLSPEWQQFLLRKKLLGYDDIVHFVREGHESAVEYENLIATIAKKTRNYAKRQIAFGSMLARKVHQADAKQLIISVNLSTESIDQAAAYLANRLKGIYE
ncbi:MAG: tRNA dimethylallyltransferase [Candidatus Dependentiae bacterium ADurb.Bin331]|nr:MAG: tRNA dimethylallyltransferase [Candidatus Dependentiae bacterium ADurb.Bin331]